MPLKTQIAMRVALGIQGFRVCVLASGSKGNAVYVSDGKTSVLIDAGLSAVEIERRFHSSRNALMQLSYLMNTLITFAA